MKGFIFYQFTDISFKLQYPAFPRTRQWLSTIRCDIWQWVRSPRFILLDISQINQAYITLKYDIHLEAYPIAYPERGRMVTNKHNADYMRLTSCLSIWNNNKVIGLFLYDMIKYLSFQTNVKPFPFRDWPYDEDNNKNKNKSELNSSDTVSVSK